MEIQHNNTLTEKTPEKKNWIKPELIIIDKGIIESGNISDITEDFPFATVISS